MKPATDLCSKCQRCVFNIKNDGNLSEEEKRSLLHDYSSHLDNARGKKRILQEQVHRVQGIFRRYNLDQVKQGKY